MILDDLQPLTFERTLMRLVALASARDGTLDAGDVENDEQLARNRPLTSAAARMLAGGVGVKAVPEADGWFPFKWLTLTEFAPPPVEAERQYEGRREREV
jgi:hypothetical protein